MEKTFRVVPCKDRKPVKMERNYDTKVTIGGKHEELAWPAEEAKGL